MEYQNYATLGVNLNRQKYGPLDISTVFNSQADLDYYLSKGSKKANVSEYWLSAVPYPYEGQILALADEDTCAAYIITAWDETNQTYKIEPIASESSDVIDGNSEWED